MKIGILGSGAIANKMAETILNLKDKNTELYAIGASNYDKALQFGQKYGIKKIYGDYDSLVKDENIDLIYIATIHTLHFEQAILCLENGRNVLVEKPFTINQKQAEILFEKAKEKNLFICEAIWTRFMPSAQYFKQLKENKIIGEISSIVANIGYDIKNVARMNSLEYAGGALLDIGLYPIHFAMMVLGNDVKEIKGECMYLESGVDAVDSITMKWDNAIATLHATMLANTDRSGYIYGTKGYIKVDNINNPHKVERYLNGECVETIDFSKQITGYEFEVLAALNAIKNQQIMDKEVDYSLTLQVMSYLDQLRKSWSIVFPQEKN